MSTDADLKRKLRSMLGTSVLAVSLSSVPFSFDLSSLSVDTPAAQAKGGEGGDSGGGEGGGEGGDSGGESGDSGEGGNSGSGSGNSGSGSGESGEGGNSGSGSGNSGSGSGNSGESGESGNSGSGSGGESGRGKGKSGSYSSGESIPARFGHVVNSSRTGRGMEVQYSDGWSESIRSGRYYLRNPLRKAVISRRARNSDFRRLRQAIK